MSCDIYQIRGEELSNYWPSIFDSEEDKDPDDWYRERLLIYGFNYAYNNTATNYMRVGDKSMRDVSFRNTEKGKLTHLYYMYASRNQWVNIPIL